MNERQPLTVCDLASLAEEMHDFAKDEARREYLRQAAELLRKADSESIEESNEAYESEYNLPFALNIARLWKAGKLIGGDPHAVVAALLQELEKNQPVTGGGQKDPLGPATPSPFIEDGDPINGIVNAIVSDICDRKGLEDSWREVDRETQAEILEKWRGIVASYMRGNAVVEPRDENGDVLVNFGDMTGFTMDSLKKIMAGGIDNNHEGLVEEYIKVFNYAVTQGIHPGQALLACIQAIGSLLGFAIRSGMHHHVAAAMTALIIKTTQQAATEVRIVTTN